MRQRSAHYFHVNSLSKKMPQGVNFRHSFRFVPKTCPLFGNLSLRQSIGANVVEGQLFTSFLNEYRNCMKIRDSMRYSMGRFFWKFGNMKNVSQSYVLLTQVHSPFWCLCYGNTGYFGPGWPFVHPLSMSSSFLLLTIASVPNQHWITGKCRIPGKCRILLENVGYLCPPDNTAVFNSL